MADKEDNKTKEEELKTEVVEEAAVEDVGESTVNKESEGIEETESVEESVEDQEVNVEGSEKEEPLQPQETESDKLPEFRVGDTIKVDYKIIEGEKVRTQPYQGIVISKKGEGLSKTFTVRKIGADSVGVERIFPYYSPNIEDIKVMKRGKVRRAKLYYLRDRIGRKATQIKERVQKK